MTPEQQHALNQALTAFAAAVAPAANAALAAAKAAYAAHPVFRVTYAAGYAVDAAAHAVNAAARVVDVAARAVGAVRAADAAASAAAYAVYAVFAASASDTSDVASDASDASNAAAHAVEAAARAEDVAALLEVLPTAERAAVAALKEGERFFAKSSVPADALAAGGDRLRKLGRGPRRLVGAAVAMLPAADRAWFGEEWVSMLVELPTRRARARQLCSLLRGAPRQGWVLRRPEPGRRPT